MDQTVAKDEQTSEETEEPQWIAEKGCFQHVQYQCSLRSFANGTSPQADTMIISHGIPNTGWEKRAARKDEACLEFFLTLWHGTNTDI